MILDTNAVSDLVEGNELVRAIISREAHVPVVVMGEYRFGLMGGRLSARSEHVISDLLKVLKPMECDMDTARVYAHLRHELREKGTPIPENDIWIAALARQHQMPVLSRDRHFDAVAGLNRLTW